MRYTTIFKRKTTTTTTCYTYISIKAQTTTEQHVTRTCRSTDAYSRVQRLARDAFRNTTRRQLSEEAAHRMLQLHTQNMLSQWIVPTEHVYCVLFFGNGSYGIWDVGPVFILNMCGQFVIRVDTGVEYECCAYRGCWERVRAIFHKLREWNALEKKRATSTLFFPD